MSKARNLANYVSANTVDATELGYLDGVTSSIQTQLDNISVTSGSLTKTFTNGETASITLSGAISPAPVVSVTKEVSQVGVSSKGSWDVATDGANYELHDTAYAVTLTPSSASSDGTFTLGSGSFASTDVGKRIVGNGGEAILTAADGSYSVVTAFDDSSAIASGSWSMFALTFDGTDGVAVNSLIDPARFDLASNTSNTASLSSASWGGVTFKTDGTKMYVTEYGGNQSVQQWSLSTAWDVSTATSDSVSFRDANWATPMATQFSSDGTKMFVLARSTDTVYGYTLSTAWDVSTASYANDSVSITTYNPSPYGFYFVPDGSKFFVSGDSRDTVVEYTMSTNYDVSTASFTREISVSAQDGTPYGITLSPDGKKLIVMGNTGDTVIVYTLPTAYSLNGATLEAEYSGIFNTIVLNPAFDNTGQYFYFINSSTNNVEQWDVATFYQPTSQYHPTVTKASGQIDTGFWTDINTMTADETLNGGEVYYAVSTDDRTTWAVIDDTDGVRNIVRDNSGTWQYNNATSSTPYSLSSASYDSKSLDVSAEEVNVSSIQFNTDGTKMFIVGYSGDEVNEYNLSTAYDITTASAITTFFLGSQEGVPRSFVFNPTGTTMFVVGSSNDTIYQYTLTTGYDLSTASYANKSFSVGSQLTIPEGIALNNDGTKVYVAGNSYIYEYDLSTAYDISTASYNSVNFNTNGSTLTPADLHFNSTGTKLFVASDSNFVYQHTLSTAYDLSTASYDSISFNAGSQVADLKGFCFNGDGTKMYLADPNTDAIYQYSTEDIAYTTSETWTNATTNNELYALQEALTEVSVNRMNSTQLNAVTDPNHYTLGDTLDLALMLYTASAGSIPESDGVSINYDAAALNQGAVVGTDYNFDFPNSTTVRITSNAAQNLKVRVV